MSSADRGKAWLLAVAATSYALFFGGLFEIPVVLSPFWGLTLSVLIYLCFYEGSELARRVLALLYGVVGVVLLCFVQAAYGAGQPPGSYLLASAIAYSSSSALLLSPSVRAFLLERRLTRHFPNADDDEPDEE